MANIKGITIEIGGNTQPLNKALSDVNKKSKDLQSELREVERLLKLDPKNTELLAQKQKLLAEAVANCKEKLDRLKNAQEQVNEQFKKGEISEEQYRAFQREVVRAEQDLQKFEKQLKETGLTAAQVGQKLQDAGQKMTSVGKDMTMKVTAPIVAAGAASFKFAADLQDAMGATDQIFGKASGTVQKWADNLESYYGIAEGEALEYSNMMGSLLKNIGGLSEKEAAKQSQALVELAGDLTAMFGGTTSDAVRALTGALKGNNSMLDNYGIAANEAMIKAKALEMGLVSEGGQMDLAAKQAATLALIMEQTGAAQGQAAREADGASGTLRGLQTELKNVAAELGQVLIPIITPFVAKIKEIVKAFGDMSPATQKVTLAIAGIAAAIGPVLVIIGAIASGVGAVIGALPALGAALAALTGPVGIAIAAIVGIGAALVALYKNNEEFRDSVNEIWTEIKQSIKSAIDQITAWWKEWGPAIIAIIKPIWEIIKTIITTVLKVIGEAVSLFLNIMTGDWEGALKDIKDIAQALWDGIKGIFTGLMNTLAGIWNLIVQGARTQWNNFKEAIINPIRSAKETVLSIIDSIKSAFANMRIEIPRPKLPHISVNWKSVGVGDARVSIPDFDLSWYKMGGIFARPSIIGVGEAGTEAVIPLDKLPGMIAGALREAMGGSQVAMAGGVTVQNMYVRNDNDIKLVARELYNLQQTNARGRGLR